MYLVNNTLGSRFGRGWGKYGSEEAGWIPKTVQHLLLMSARGQLAPNLPQKRTSKDERYMVRDPGRR